MSLLKEGIFDVLNSPLSISLGSNLFFLYALYFILVINNKNGYFFKFEIKNRISSIDSTIILVGILLNAMTKSWQVESVNTLISVIIVVIIYVYYEYILRINNETEISHHFRILWFFILSVIYFKLWISILILTVCSFFVAFIVLKFKGNKLQ